MNIILIGGGEVGHNLAKVLLKDDHNVTLLDADADILQQHREALDILTIEGHATDPFDLERANVQSADYVIAVTSIDEVNMISAILSKKMGAKKVIARCRQEYFLNSANRLKPKDLDIDVIINPEYSTANDIVRKLRQESVSDTVEIADGKLRMVSIRLSKHSPVLGRPLADVVAEYSEVPFRIIVIQRGNITIFPNGTEVLYSNDLIFIFVLTPDVEKLLSYFQSGQKDLHTVMIAGGTLIGTIVARELIESHNRKWNVKLVEPDVNKAERLAEELTGALVIHGDPTNIDILVAEGVGDTDAFVAVSGDEESNIISCLLAKHIGVRRTVALVSKTEYMPISHAIGLDAIVSKKATSSNEIRRLITKDNIISMVSLQNVEGDIVELKVGEKSSIVGRALNNIKIPRKCVMGAVLRNGHIEIATGQTVFQAGDDIILFCIPTMLKKIENLVK